MTETQSTCKVNTNVSHESVKLCDMDFSRTNKCIPSPFLKKIDCTKYLKQNYLLVTLRFQDYLHSLPNFTIHRI